MYKTQLIFAEKFTSTIEKENSEIKQRKLCGERLFLSHKCLL